MASNKAKVILTAENRTANAFNDAKRGLADLAMAADRSRGQLGSFLKLSPQLVALGATAGIAGAAFKGLYERNANLQSSAGKLGEAWDRFTISIGNVLPIEAAGRAIEWVAEKVNALANKLSRATPDTQQMSDKEWQEILKKSEENYNALIEQDKKQKELAEKRNRDNEKADQLRRQTIEKSAGDFERVWESTLNKEKALALQYNKDTADAVEYMRLQPKEKERVISTLLALEEKYQNDLSALRENAGKNNLNDPNVIAEQYKTGLDRVTEETERAASNRIAIDEREKKEKFDIAAGSFANLSTLMQSGSKREFEIGKKAALATAVIKGIEAIQSSYAAGAKFGGPLLGAAFAATAAVATKMNVDAISRQSFGGGGSITSGGGGAPPTTISTDIPSQRNSQQAPISNTIIIKLGDREIARVVADGLKIADQNDMIVLQNGRDFERINVV